MSSAPEPTVEPPGDPSRHLDRAALVAGLTALAPPPRDRGMLRMLVARAHGGTRRLPEEAVLHPETALPGDRWTPDNKFGLESQLAVMRYDVASLIANGQSLALFGDNLLVDLDVSRSNLPEGTRLRIGGCTLAVTPAPHNGCKKFRARFGMAALKLTGDRRFHEVRVRGIYLKVVEAGAVRVGDAIDVLRQ